MRRVIRERIEKARQSIQRGPVPKRKRTWKRKPVRCEGLPWWDAK